MPSSLFGGSTGENSIIGAISALKSASQGNPQALFDHLYQSNPQFHAFADSMRDKTPEQAFRENGMDFEQIRGMIR